MRVFHNYNANTLHEKHCNGKIRNKELVASRKDDNINPYFSNDLNVKYLICTDQMYKFKPTEYYVVYNFETMEESLDNNIETTEIEREDDETAYSSSSSQPPSSSSSTTEGTTKVSNIILLSAAWTAKIRSGIKTGYFDRRDGPDFIIKWLESLIEVAGEVTKYNMFDCINYVTENIPNFVPVLGFNSDRIDMNFIIDILHNPPIGIFNSLLLI
jgi:hypothetical protein